MRKLILATLALALMSLQAQAGAASPFVETRAWAAELGFLKWLSAPDSPPKNKAEATPEAKPVAKIAIFDTGFAGYESAMRDGSLPPPERVFYHKADVPGADPSREEHGRAMAQIVYSLLREARLQEKLKIEIHLFEVSSYASLDQAIQALPGLGIRLVLNSQVWEWGGNDDGRGVYNAKVDEATSRGAIWVNATGSNAKDAVYAAAARLSQETAIDGDPLLALPFPGDTLSARCRGQQGRKCALRAVLTWNAYGDSPQVGTDKDLDLELLVRDGASAQLPWRVLATSKNRQSKNGAPGTTPVPREMINAEIDPQQADVRGKTYAFRIRAHAPELIGDGDRFRLVVSGYGVEIDNASKEDTLFNPADNPSAITVGAYDDEASSFNNSLGKPELLGRSQLTLRERWGTAAVGTVAGGTVAGGPAAGGPAAGGPAAGGPAAGGPAASGPATSSPFVIGNSNSAASVAAGFLAMLAYRPAATRAELLAAVQDGSGYPLSALGFAGTGANGCFETVPMPSARPPLLAYFPPAGATAVQTTSGLKVFVWEDPIEWLRKTGAPVQHPPWEGLVGPGLMATIFAGGGADFLPRGQWQNTIARQFGAFEVVRDPIGARLCGANHFYLPDPSAWIED